MKALSIGDTHGHPVVEEVKKLLPEYDKIIFIGDYVDSFTLTNPTISHNLFDLIQFRKDNPDKVVLLWGNHDLHYLFGSMLHRCTGYRPEARFDLYDMFNKNRELFKAAYQVNNSLWTHAGIHAGWYKQRFNKYIKTNNLEGFNISDQICYAFDRYEKSLFDVGYLRGGNYDVGGPFWCDRRELTNNPLRGYHQIVGHTKVSDYNTIHKYNDTSVTFIDIIESHMKDCGHLRSNSFYPLKIKNYVSKRT